MRIAPVALFVYNRPHHTKKTIEALQQNYLAGDTELFIFADGAKPNALPEDLENIKRVRSIVSDIEGFKIVHLEFSPGNKGLAASLISGINKVLENSEEVIVVEDDILSSKYF